MPEITIFHCRRGKQSAGFGTMYDWVVVADPILRLKINSSGEQALFLIRERGWKIVKLPFGNEAEK